MARWPYNLEGRWTGGGFEMNLVMNGSEFNVKPITAELKQYWTAASGEVFESGKLHATFSGPHPDITIQGFVTADGKTIQWSNNATWTKH
jgi:hypothetical protein